jgi:hypothetical protein
MRYTAVQNMHDVKRTMDETAKREPVTVEAVTAYYASVRCSSAGENISKVFVGCSMTVLRRVIVLPQRERLAMHFAEAGLHIPLDSIFKLSKIATRARTEGNLVWVMQ